MTKNLPQHYPALGCNEPCKNTLSITYKLPTCKCQQKMHCEKQNLTWHLPNKELLQGTLQACWHRDPVSVQLKVFVWCQAVYHAAEQWHRCTQTAERPRVSLCHSRTHGAWMQSSSLHCCLTSQMPHAVLRLPSNAAKQQNNQYYYHPLLQQPSLVHNTGQQTVLKHWKLLQPCTTIKHKLKQKLVMLIILILIFSLIQIWNLEIR